MMRVDRLTKQPGDKNVIFGTVALVMFFFSQSPVIFLTRYHLETLLVFLFARATTHVKGRRCPRVDSAIAIILSQYPSRQ